MRGSISQSVEPFSRVSCCLTLGGSRSRMMGDETVSIRVGCSARGFQAADVAADGVKERAESSMRSSRC